VKRRLLSLAAIFGALMVGMTAFAVSSWAATNPVWTVPANGTESTHMNTDLDLVGKLSVTSPQGEDLAIFVSANHGKFMSNNNPNNNVCPLGVIANGTFCSYADPTVPQANWNFRGTLAQVSQALNNVTYTPDLNFPQPANGTLIDSVLISATEQNIAVGLTGTTNFEIEVLPANQAPFFDTIPDVVTGVETDANSVYDFINDINITDPGGYTCDSAMDGGRSLTVAVTQGGTLSTSYVSAGFSVLGNGTPLLTMTGSTVDLNNAMNSMHYTPVPFLAYTETVTLHTDDNGCVGYPGALVADGAFPLYVKPLAANHYTVVAPATATTGVSTMINVSARDQYENLVPTYAGIAHLTSSDGAAVLGADTALAAGVANFNVTFNTTGNQTVTATDTVDGSINGLSNTVLVANPQVTTHFLVSAPASAVAGAPVGITVTAQDAANTTATNYSGTVHFTSSDPAATLPADVGLLNGTGVFVPSFNTAGVQSFTATDTVNMAITGTDSLTIDPGPAATLTATAPATATNGTGIMVHVVAHDAFNNIATGYAGTIHLTSTDGAAVLAADGGLTSGQADFAVTLNTDGMQTVTATDTVTAALTDTTANIDVSSVVVPVATHFDVAAPATATAGSSFAFTVTAKDAGNFTVTGYSGTVHLTSTDGGATLPADLMLVNGVGNLNATFTTAGNQTLTATDTVTMSITGNDTVSVSAANATHVVLTVPGSAVAGTSFLFDVTAKDQFNNTDTGYSGTVHFTSTDGGATLPADLMLVNGTAQPSATLTMAGARTITGTDTVAAAITGTSGSINVIAGNAATFTVSAPPAATVGVAFNVDVSAYDAFNNPAFGYAGTVHFTSTDGAAVLPANTTLVNGAGTFSATLNTTGSQDIIATDTVTASITGMDSVMVSAVPPGPATHFMVTAPANATAGSSFSVSVTALDAGNATAVGYSGTVHFTSTDGSAVLPADATLTNGAGSFSVTLNSTGGQTITATDNVDGTINGTSSSVVVAVAPPGAAVAFQLTTPANATAGQSFSVTVTAVDGSNATATGYTGLVHFTSTDGQAVLPADALLVNGVGMFNVTLETSGMQTVHVEDSLDANIFGANVVDVAPGAPSQMKVSPPPPGATQGVAFAFTVEVLDQFGNRVTNYSGTIHFTSSDPNAVLPADAVLNGGFATFSATLNTAGPQTLGAADVSNAQLNGISVAAEVAAATQATTTTTTTPGSTTSTVFGSNTNPVFTGSLPVTGSPTGVMVLFGLVLTAAGALLLAVRRRTV
jgi:LPXTG-motif cell wall-anchored protein